MRTPLRTVFPLILALLGAGCPAPPQTVASVDLARYTGLWYEIASYEVFFNRGLVGVTAEYALRDDGRISVFNRGFSGGLDGPEESIRGVARVVDRASNAKLAVRFDQPFGWLFEGRYWIVDLDAEDYAWAVVSDPFRMTLFILGREATLDSAVLGGILARLELQGFDTGRLRYTAQRGLAGAGGAV